MESLSKVHYEINDEIADAMVALGADCGLISIIMSWGDTLTSKEVRDQLIEFNGNQPQHQSDSHRIDALNG